MLLLSLYSVSGLAFLCLCCFSFRLLSLPFFGGFHFRLALKNKIQNQWICHSTFCVFINPSTFYDSTAFFVGIKTFLSFGNIYIDHFIIMILGKILVKTIRLFISLDRNKKENSTPWASKHEEIKRRKNNNFMVV